MKQLLKNILNIIITVFYYLNVSILLKRIKIWHFLFIGIIVSVFYYTIDWYIVNTANQISEIKVSDNMDACDVKKDALNDANNINKKKEYLFSSETQENGNINKKEESWFSTKNIIIVTSAIAVTSCILFGAYCIYINLQIPEEQCAEKTADTLREIVKNTKEYLEKNPVALPEVSKVVTESLQETMPSTDGWSLLQYIQYNRSITMENLADWTLKFYQGLLTEELTQKQIQTVIYVLDKYTEQLGGEKLDENELTVCVSKFFQWFKNDYGTENFHPDWNLWNIVTDYVKREDVE